MECLFGGQDLDFWESAQESTTHIGSPEDILRTAFVAKMTEDHFLYVDIDHLSAA